MTNPNPNTCQFPKTEFKTTNTQCLLWLSPFYTDDQSIFWQTLNLKHHKNTAACLSSFPDETQNHFRCHFYSSLHIHTKTNPHKVSKITQRYLQKCSYQRPCVEYSQRTPCLLLLISGLFSTGECLVEGDEWSCREGSRLCCIWALEPLVTGHCQVGSVIGPASGLTRNAAALSVVKEL